MYIVCFCYNIKIYRKSTPRVYILNMTFRNCSWSFANFLWKILNAQRIKSTSEICIYIYEDGYLKQAFCKSSRETGIKINKYILLYEDKINGIII